MSPSCASTSPLVLLSDEFLGQRRALLCCSATSLLGSDEPSCAAHQRASCAATSSLVLPSDKPSWVTMSVQRRALLCCQRRVSCEATNPLVQRRVLLCGDESAAPSHLMLPSDEPSCAATSPPVLLSDESLGQRRALLCCPATSLLCGDEPSCATQRRVLLCSGDESAATSPLVLLSDEPSCEAMSPLVQRQALLCCSATSLLCSDEPLVRR